jgi:hypothetical protein
MRITRLVSPIGTLTPIFVPLHALFWLLFPLTNEQSTSLSLSKLAMDYILLSVKIALLSVNSLKKLKPTTLPTPNTKRLIKSPLLPTSLSLSLIVLHLPCSPWPLPLPQSQSLLTSRKYKAKITLRSFSLKFEPLSNGLLPLSNYLTNSLTM